MGGVYRCSYLRNDITEISSVQSDVLLGELEGPDMLVLGDSKYPPNRGQAVLDRHLGPSVVPALEALDAVLGLPQLAELEPGPDAPRGLGWTVLDLDRLGESGETSAVVGREHVLVLPPQVGQAGL